MRGGATDGRGTGYVARINRNFHRTHDARLIEHPPPAFLLPPVRAFFQHLARRVGDDATTRVSSDGGAKTERIIKGADNSRRARGCYPRMTVPPPPSLQLPFHCSRVMCTPEGRLARRRAIAPSGEEGVARVASRYTHISRKRFSAFVSACRDRRICINERYHRHVIFAPGAFSPIIAVEVRPVVRLQ